MPKNTIMTRCGELRQYWYERNKKFKIWYKLIEMIDELKQDKMESFVGSDPQSSFKLLRHMIAQKVPHKVPHNQVTTENAGAATELGTSFSTMWENVNDRYRLRGKQGWVWDLAGFLLATGWYSVFAMISQDGEQCIADILNPATVYPIWDSELVECARIETLDAMAINRICIRNNWSLPATHWWNFASSSSRRIYDYWRLDDGGKVYNTIAIDNELVKPETYEPRFSRIPIFVAPVGGLPDNGLLTEDNQKWKGEIGMGSVATNENLYRYWNKMWTFSMQLLRDTAQARIIEKTRGDKRIVKPEDVFKRGAIFRMGVDEDVSFMTPPVMPIELRSTQIDMEAMMQRGGPSWAMFGAAQGSMTAFVMSQISAATNQVAHPYHQGVIDCMSDIDNFWYEQIRKFSYKPYKIALPKGLADDIKLTAEYEIKIPGDLIQRATVARMLDPDFRLSYRRVIEELFPEIKSPAQEKAFIRADKAELHPVNSMIDLVVSLKKQAKILRTAGDIAAAQLHEKAAANVERALSLSEEEAAPPPEVAPTRRAIGSRIEGAPPSLGERQDIAPIA